MAGAAELDVTIHGRGAHGACPDASIDPVVVAAAVVLRLQTIVARETHPTEPLVVTVGTVNAGVAANVIPESARLGITVRAFTEHRLDKAVEAVNRMVRAECAACGWSRTATASAIDPYSCGCRSHNMKSPRSLRSNFRNEDLVSCVSASLR